MKIFGTTCEQSLIDRLDTSKCLECASRQGLVNSKTDRRLLFFKEYENFFYGKRLLTNLFALVLKIMFSSFFDSKPFHDVCELFFFPAIDGSRKWTIFLMFCH